MPYGTTYQESAEKAEEREDRLAAQNEISRLRTIIRSSAEDSVERRIAMPKQMFEMEDTFKKCLKCFEHLRDEHFALSAKIAILDSNITRIESIIKNIDYATERTEDAVSRIEDTINRMDDENRA